MPQRSVKMPITWSRDEAVGILKESGVVGAGGAGFPTYVKYQDPQPTLLVNAAESEPGYYADKLLLREKPQALVDLFRYLREGFGVEDIIIGAEDVAEPYMGPLEEAAEETGLFRIEYFAPKYKFGQERALAKEVLGVEIPKDELPQDQGIVVNNNETLLNVARALFDDRPVTTKFTHLYGEVEPLTVYEAPIGTLTHDLLEIHGTAPEEVADCAIWDGGPILSDKVVDPVGEDDPYPLHRNSNAFLVTAPDLDQPKNKVYPHEDHDHNTVDCPMAADEIVNVEDEVERVRVPVEPAFGEPPIVTATEGDQVEKGQPLGRPRSGLSVGIHASIPGTVTEVTDEHVEIMR